MRSALPKILVVRGSVLRTTRQAARGEIQSISGTTRETKFLVVLVAESRTRAKPPPQ
jgi:hypothetical protein